MVPVDAVQLRFGIRVGALLQVRGGSREDFTHLLDRKIITQVLGQIFRLFGALAALYSGDCLRESADALRRSPRRTSRNVQASNPTLVRVKLFPVEVPDVRQNLPYSSGKLTVSSSQGYGWLCPVPLWPSTASLYRDAPRTRERSSGSDARRRLRSPG